jgi:hypothetical protein
VSLSQENLWQIQPLAPFRQALDHPDTIMLKTPNYNSKFNLASQKYIISAEVGAPKALKKLKAPRGEAFRRLNFIFWEI